MIRDRASLLAGLLWTAPWWLGFLLFLAIPLGASLYLSFCDYSLLQPPVFTGSLNYQNLAQDAIFYQVVRNTFVYTALSVPVSTAIALLLAVLLNQSIRGQAFFRACIFLPTILPLVAAAMIWMWMLNPEVGLANAPFRGLGIPPPPWLTNSAWAVVALVLISLWFVGSPTVIFLASLQEIPEELYEAARLDGASAAGRFRHITLPGVSPVVLFNFIIAVLTAWQIFALPFVIWRREKGPGESTYFYTSYLFDNAFRFLKMGYASAMAWIQLIIILAVTALVFYLSRRMVHYRGS